jgi:hypothetical protein
LLYKLTTPHQVLEVAGMEQGSEGVGAFVLSCLWPLDEDRGLITAAVDGEQLLSLLASAAQQEFDLCVTLLQIYSTDERGQLFFRQAPYPDINADPIARASLCQIAVIKWIDEVGVAWMRRSPGTINLECAALLRRTRRAGICYNWSYMAEADKAERSANIPCWRKGHSE